MGDSEYCEVFYFYDAIDGADVLVNPKYFVIRSYSNQSNREITINTNPEFLEEIQQRFIEEGGIEVKVANVKKTKFEDGIEKIIDEDREALLVYTGRLSLRIVSDLVRNGKIDSYLIDMLKQSKSDHEKEIIAREILENAFSTIGPINKRESRNYFDYAIIKDEEMDDYESDDDDEEDEF